MRAAIAVGDNSTVRRLRASLDALLVPLEPASDGALGNGDAPGGGRS
jgi:hypothetical protein